MARDKLDASKCLNTKVSKFIKYQPNGGWGGNKIIEYMQKVLYKTIKKLLKKLSHIKLLQLS